MIGDLVETAAASFTSADGIALLGVCLGVALGTSVIRSKWGRVRTFQGTVAFALIALASVWALTGYRFNIGPYEGVVFFAVVLLGVPALAISSARLRVLVGMAMAVVVAGTLPAFLFLATCFGPQQCN